MIAIFRALPFPTVAAVLGLSACAAVKKAGEESVDFMQSAAGTTSSKVAALSEKVTHKLTPAGVPVVEVREKDLKKMPTGKERVLAFENSRKRSLFSFFSGPVDFQEPVLPEPDGSIDASLLPPKSP